MSINTFLLKNNIRIKNNPAISPDMVLDFETIYQEIADSAETISAALANPAMSTNTSTLTIFKKSDFLLDGKTFLLVNHTATGDEVLVSDGTNLPFCGIRKVGDISVIPLTAENFIHLKNYSQKHDPENTLFPVATGSLEHTSLGIGARMTTMHWPAVAWSMKKLNLPLTANQNSIPRELIYDIDAMLENRLTELPFLFIGADVPEGHQGQSVKGMSHSSVTTYLKYGFHKNRIPWGFNADHQPVGGRFDKIEDELVEGCLYATYITFDLSPELTETTLIENPIEVNEAFENLDSDEKNLYIKTREILIQENVKFDENELKKLTLFILPSMKKLKIREEKYSAVRAKYFTTEIGKKYFRELSIDELPGLTTPATLAACLAMSKVMGIQFNFVAPNIGFQKNTPFPDNSILKERIDVLYAIAKQFGVGIGFHSGSGKSGENYAICGENTEGNFEIKTSGRYTYEFGKALSQSTNEKDQKLWLEWYDFTRKLALNGAFAEIPEQQTFAREFISATLNFEEISTDGVFDSKEKLATVLDSLVPNAEHMLWFEYNFLFVLCAEDGTLGDHTPAGYAQRERFYSISDESKLLFAKGIASYIIFLAKTTGIVAKDTCAEITSSLEQVKNYSEFLAEISG